MALIQRTHKRSPALARFQIPLLDGARTRDHLPSDLLEISELDDAEMDAIVAALLPRLWKRWPPPPQMARAASIEDWPGGGG